MKRTATLIGVIAGACMTVGFAAGSKWTQPGQPQDAQGQDVPPEMQEMMDAFIAYGTPGKEHEWLAKRVGTWDATIKHWMAPGAPPALSSGTANFMPIMDGRYVLQEYEGESPMGPFTGAGLVAFDNLKKKYQGIWIDSMSTGIMYTEGDMEDGSLVSVGYMPDPMSGKFISAKTIERMPNDDTFIMEMHQPGPDGKLFKSMEITYKRTSAPGGGTAR